MDILDDTELQALNKEHIKMEMACNFILRKGNNENKSKTSLKLDRSHKSFSDVTIGTRIKVGGGRI